MKLSAGFLALALVAIIVPTSVLSYLSSASAGDRVCATTTVNARSRGSLSGTVLTKLRPGECGEILGRTTNSDGYKWFQLTFKGQVVWVAGNYLYKDSSSTSSSSSSSSSCPRIVSRSAWGARAAKKTSPMPQPASFVFIHHSDSPACSSQDACAARVQNIQTYHMYNKAEPLYDDIGYSFLVGGDGAVYEGRGWDILGAHTVNRTLNSIGYGICFIGNFDNASPTPAQVQSAKDLIACGVAKGKISSTYKLRGHRDMKATACPGNVLYNLIKTWPHYY